MSVELTFDQQVATVTINRPEVHNALDPDTIQSLTNAFTQLNDNSDVRVVVLTGEGKSFCAGADLAWMKKTAELSEAENVQDALYLAELMHALDGLHKPTVARVNGHAFGGGVGLLCCCDVVVAQENALISLSEVRLGLTPSVISPFVVNAIGVRNARRLFLTAEKQSAEQAKTMGLAHEVVTADELDDKVSFFVNELRQGGPLALHHAKRLARSYAFDASRLDELKRETAKMMGQLRVSPEGQEGFKAFLEKRPPSWVSDTE
ncbi:MAG: enoyl-CoA hydratase/isomerase family protein [Gammaproteobacteria bacterium]|nr:enoyl-CoA hydratase/isomerase family protein [Gammaproteobacteria bacterium]